MKKSFYLSGLLAVCLNLFSGAASAQAVVTADPVNVTTCAGSTAMFRITATGATAYVWQVSANGGATWYMAPFGSVYTTPTDDTMHVTAVDSVNGHIFRCIAFGTTVNDTSNAALLTIETASAGVVTGPNAVCVGSTITFSSTVAGGTWSNVDHTIDHISASGVDTGKVAGMDTVKYTFTNSCGTNISYALVRVDAPLSPSAITGPSNVCVGGHITLMDANVTGTHTWTSGNTAVATVDAASGVVTGVSHGNALITYSIANACNTVTVNHLVSVDTVINAGTITGAASVCSGSWTTLTASVGGGIWLSGNTAVAVVDGSGNVTGVSQGTSIISYYFSNSCGASFASHTITIVVPAAAITGNDSVGIDSTLMLSNTTTGGTWTSQYDTVASIAASGLVTGHDTGITVITYNVTNACGTSSSSLVLHVGPLPVGGTIAGPDTICLAATATFVDTTGYGIVTHWRSKYDTIATISDAGVLTPVSSGIDSIYATVTTAFGSKIVKKKIYINKPPVTTLVAPPSVSYGGVYELIGTPVGGVFTTSNPVMAPLTAYGHFVVLGFGQTIFTYTATNSCGSTTARDTIDLADPASVAGVNGQPSTFNVFPNPSNGSLTINLAAANNETAVVVVTNVVGEKVKELTINSNTNTQFTLDQPAGMYLLNATTQSGAKYSTKINVIK